MIIRKRVKGNNHVFKSVFVASKGLVSIIQREGGIKLILCSLILFISLSIYFQLTTYSVLFISFSWLHVLISEIFNTAIEIDMDYTSDKAYNPLIKRVKDYAAAGVFLSSCFALIVTTVLFTQHFS